MSTSAEAAQTALRTTGLAVVLAVVIAKRRDLMLYCFDPIHAQAIREWREQSGF